MTTAGATKLLLTPNEAAEQLAVSSTKVYELMAAGTLRSIHIGRLAPGSGRRAARLHRGHGVSMSGRGRRGHGEGSVFQRPNGMWVAQVDLGWIGGRRRRRTVYGSSEREVLAKRDQLRSQLVEGRQPRRSAANSRAVAERMAQDRQGRRRNKPVNSRPIRPDRAGASHSARRADQAVGARAS